MPFRAGFFVADVIHRHDLAIGTLNASHIADVSVCAVFPQYNLGPPRFPIVCAQARPDAVRIGSEPARQAQTTIS